MYHPLWSCVGPAFVSAGRLFASGKQLRRSCAGPAPVLRWSCVGPAGYAYGYGNGYGYECGMAMATVLYYINHITPYMTPWIDKRFRDTPGRTPLLIRSLARMMAQKGPRN